MEIDTKVLLKNKVLILLSLLLVVLVIGGGWYLSGKMFEAFDARTSRPSREDVLKSLTEKVLKLDGIDVELYRKRSDEMLLRVLPEKVDLSRALGGLVTIVRDGDFEVKSGLTNNAAGLETQLQTQKVDIKFVGEATSLRKVLERLEKVKPLMKAVNLDVVYIDLKTANYNLTVETYGWEGTPAPAEIESVSLPVIENGGKYEQLFKDIESWEEIIPSLDFVFEGSETRDPFYFDNERNIIMQIEQISPTPTVTQEVIPLPTPTDEI